MEHLQSCPLLVLFMQIHDLASVENFGQKLSKWKHFPKSLNHYSSLLRLQSPFFGSVTQLVSSHMGGMNISLWNIRDLHFVAYFWRQHHLAPLYICWSTTLFSPPAIASSTSLLLLLRTFKFDFFSNIFDHIMFVFSYNTCFCLFMIIRYSYSPLADQTIPDCPGYCQTWGSRGIRNINSCEIFAQAWTFRGLCE